VSSDLDLDPLLKRLHLANARRAWRDLVQRAEKEQWSYDALLLTLFSEEVAHRRGTRLTRAVSAAAFPFLRTIDEFDFTYQSTLRLTTIGSLLTPDFVTEGHSVILEGKPGRGKTHLAIALAYRAMQNGFDALFTTAAELIDELSAASKDGKLRDALARYIKPHVLVVDEVGYLPYGDDAASVLYHVVNDRHIRRRAMVFTTNKHPKRWGDVLHDDDLAEAIVDRVLERGRLLRLDGPSLRTKHLPDDELQLNQDIQGDRRVSGKDPAEFPERTRDVSRTLRPSAQRNRNISLVLLIASRSMGSPVSSSEPRRAGATQPVTSFRSGRSHPRSPCPRPADLGVHVVAIPAFTSADPGVHMPAILAFTSSRSCRSREREIRRQTKTSSRLESRGPVCGWFANRSGGFERSCALRANVEQ